MATVLTTCPFCTCGCGLHLQADHGHLTGSAPSEHHPVGQGKLCARGWHAHEAPTWGQRLTRPLLRRGGAPVEVSWAEAVDAVVQGLSRILADGDLVGVLGSARATNEENFLAVKLARGALRTGNLDFCLRAGLQPLVDGVAEVTGDPWPPGRLLDLERSEFILLFEGDLAETHPRAASLVAAAVKRGARLVTVGWHRTQMSRLAARHLPVDPGAGHQVIPGLVAAVLDGGLAGGAGVVAAVPGFAELRAGLSDFSVGEPVREAATWYASAARASIVVSEGALLPDEARDGAAALAMLAVVTGHLGRAGSALLLLPSRGNQRGALEVGVRPDALPGGLPLDDAVMIPKLRRHWSGEPAVVTGLDAEAMVAGCRGLVVVAEELPAVLRAGRSGADALAKAEFVVVLDSFATATAQSAHAVLPVAAFGETDGTTTSFDGRVQRVRECASPPGLARPGWQVLAELVTRFGLPCSYGSIGDLHREMTDLVPLFGEIGEGQLDESWGALVSRPARGTGVHLRTVGLGRRDPVEGPCVVVFDEAFDWGSDPSVAHAPTLCRDHVARRKLFPTGFVEMNKADADRLGVRPGWAVRLASKHGEVTVPVVVSGDVAPGMARLPFSARDRVGVVLGGRGRAGVRVERA